MGEFVASSLTAFMGIAIAYFATVAYLVFSERRGARPLMVLAWAVGGLPYLVVRLYATRTALTSTECYFSRS